jgi:hypothetical protein
MSSSLENFERRLTALERQNRKLRGALGLMIPLAGAVLAAFFLGQASLSCSAEKKEPPPAAASDVLRAKRLEILNEKGVAVVVASVDSRGWGRLVTYNADGQQLVQMAATDQGGTVAVAGSKGRLRAAMAVTDKDDGTVFTFDGRDQRLIALAKTAIGDGAVFSYDRIGNIAKMWPTGP